MSDLAWGRQLTAEPIGSLDKPRDDAELGRRGERTFFKQPLRNDSSGGLDRGYNFLNPV